MGADFLLRSALSGLIATALYTGAAFTMWDRMGRSFDRVRVAPWWGKPGWSKTAGAVHEAARHGDASPGLLSDS